MADADKEERTVASLVPFYQLASLLDKIGSQQGTDKKKRVLKEFIDEWRACHNKIHKDNPKTKDSFYPAMRLLLPQLEREREAYGVKEVMLAKHYIEILGLGKDSPSAQKLLNYRAPKSAKADAGDFAGVAFYILKPRCPDKGTLTIEEVNNCLNKVASSNAAKDKEGMRKPLQHMLRNMSAREQKWLIRMVLKEMKVGVSQQSILGIFHLDAEDLYNVMMSLEKVCVTLHDPTKRLHEVGISLFTPFRPMLGDRGAPHKVTQLFNGKPFFLETKFDGERMQLHKDGDTYKYFSRGGNEYTSTYGDNVFAGNFTPSVHNCFKEDVESCILDGEMVGYNVETKTIASKGGNFDIKKNNAEFQPLMCVFDVLYLNGTVLSNQPLRERLIKLRDVFEPVENHMIFSEYKEGNTREDCAEALNEAIDNREEGIMAKDPESVYKPNTRKGGWYKMKPEYIGGLMDELDLIVVGGYFGSGHRSNQMSHFLCAVAVPPSSGDKPTEFHSFCRVGSGYTRKELFDFNQKLADHWQVFSKKNPPSWLVLASGLKQRPEAFIEPKNSCILQVKAAEILDSEQYKTGCTLRFPRVEKIRDDKVWYDCMTTIEVDELRQKSSGKLASGYAEADFEDDPSKKKRKIVSRHIKPTVMSQFRGADVSTVTKVSEMLGGREICVVSAPAGHVKAEIEKKIVEFGGTIVQNPGQDTFCVLADKVAIKVRNIISKGVYDVVNTRWFLICVEQKKLMPWVPSDMIHTSPKTTKEFALRFDQFGDSYCDDTKIEELKMVFGKVEKEGAQVAVTSKDMAEMEADYFPQESPLGLFRLCRAYLDYNLVIGQPDTRLKASTLELIALDLRFHGGQVSDILDEGVSHVIVNSLDTSRVKSLREINRRHRKKFHICSEAWVSDSIAEEKWLPERPFEPL